MATILCFGEVLWDLFPDGRRLGGAPANVAYHLAQMGHAARLVSCVGEDEAGAEALSRLAEAGVDTALVARDPARPTGTVQVTLDDAGVPAFAITEDVAWDAIPVTPALRAAAGEADAVVFGSLAQRAKRSRATLDKLLDAAGPALCLCDLNLRPPFVDAEVVKRSVARVQLLKLNEDEAARLPKLLGRPGGEELLDEMAGMPPLVAIYVTRGGKGVRIHLPGTRIEMPAPQVAVADTVGAGDAFTAALLDGVLSGRGEPEISERALELGAWVASQPGAMPPWTHGLRVRFASG